MRLTIYETENGSVIVEGAVYDAIRDSLDQYNKRTWSFNSIEKATAHVRDVLKRWEATRKAALAEKGE